MKRARTHKTSVELTFTPPLVLLIYLQASLKIFLIYSKDLELRVAPYVSPNIRKSLVIKWKVLQKMKVEDDPLATVAPKVGLSAKGKPEKQKVEKVGNSEKYFAEHCNPGTI